MISDIIIVGWLARVSMTRCRRKRLCAICKAEERPMFWDVRYLVTKMSLRYCDSGEEKLVCRTWGK